MTAPADNYSAPSGLAFYAGRSASSPAPPPPGTSSLVSAIAAMAPGTFQQYSGTNINEMTYPPEADPLYSSGPYGVLESYTNALLPPWCGKLWFDPDVGLFGGLGTSAGYASQPDRSKAFYFSSVSNTFSVAWKPTNKAEGHYYDGNCSRPLNGYVYRRGYNNAQIWKMNTTTMVWSLAFTPAAINMQVVSLEVFPEMGPNGSLVIVGDNGQVWTIDAGTGVVTSRGSVANIIEYAVVVYLSGPKVVVFGGGNALTSGSTRTIPGTSLYQMDAAGAITEISQTYPVGLKVGADASCGPCTPHPDGNSIVVFSLSLLQAWKMDVSGAWTKMCDLPAPFSTLSGGQASNLINTIPVTLHGLGAIVLLFARGRNVAGPTGVTQSQFWNYKV